MPKRYQIWDRKTNVYTPSGEKFTPEMWIARYPIFEEEWAIPVIAKGSYNGAFCGELNQLKTIYEQNGVVFTLETVDESGNTLVLEMTPEECLEVIEAFEDAMNTPSTEPTTQERTALALEAIASGQTAESTAVIDALLGEDEV